MRRATWAAAIAAAWLSSSRAFADVTFNKDVAPILFKHCASCHRPGEVAPFPLLKYVDAAKRARHLVEVTSDHRMPPWLPESGQHRFLDERRLSDAEVQVLKLWAETGAKEGEPRDQPPEPKFTVGWQLGQPDLVLKMTEPYFVPADGPDQYVGFVIRIPLEKKRYLKGFEFRPGNRKLVHHAILLMDTTGAMRKLVESEKGPGFRLQEARAELLPLKVNGASIGEWNPGRTPRFMPEGIAPLVEPRADLIILMHYHPSGRVEQDQSKIGLIFTDKPGGKNLTHFPVRISPELGNTELLKIPAGEKDFKVVVGGILPGDASLFTLTPHSHYLLKTLKLTATPPGGAPVPLLEIKRWDFNQQERYVFANPPRFPKGTRIELEGHFDNSAGNPLNPSSPPKAVQWGESTTDEMIGVAIRLFPEGADSVAAFRKKPPPKDQAKLKLPPGGVVIPPESRLIREKYDLNGDGRLTQDEFDAMPESVRLRTEQILREKMGNDAVPSTGAKNQQPKENAPAKSKSTLVLPSGGFALPPEAKVLREKYDKNRDGRLSQEEFDAIPLPLRDRVEELIRKRLASEAKTVAPLPRAAPPVLPIPLDGQSPKNR